MCACGVPYGGFSASFQEERERERWRKGLCINGRSLVVVSCGGVVCVGEPHRRGFEWWVMLELDMSLFAGPAAASCAIPGQPDHHRIKQDVWGVWPCAISGRGAGGVSAARASFGGRARRVVPRGTPPSQERRVKLATRKNAHHQRAMAPRPLSALPREPKPVVWVLL